MGLLNIRVPISGWRLLLVVSYHFNKHPKQRLTLVNSMKADGLFLFLLLSLMMMMMMMMKALHHNGCHDTEYPEAICMFSVGHDAGSLMPRRHP